jgi:hypothetical protein
MSELKHDPIDTPTVGSSPAKVTPQLVGNVSVWPAAHQGGEVKIVGTGTDRRVADVAGPYAAESPRQSRDR